MGIPGRLCGVVYDVLRYYIVDISHVCMMRYIGYMDVIGVLWRVWRDVCKYMTGVDLVQAVR